MIEWLMELNLILGGLIGTVFGYGLSTFFSYKKDQKLHSNAKYVDRAMYDLYLPLYKIIYESEGHFQEYYGISWEQFSEIEKLIDENLDLVDEQLHLAYLTAAMDLSEGEVKWGTNTITDPTGKPDKEKKFTIIDEQQRDYYDHVLYDYIHYAFNKTRKTLGLPYNNSKIIKWHWLRFKSFTAFKRKYKAWKKRRDINKSIEQLKR